MKRLLALLAILLISQVGYGQQKMDQLFNAFRGGKRCYFRKYRKHNDEASQPVHRDNGSKRYRYP